jgi:hypothetical protein
MLIAGCAQCAGPYDHFYAAYGGVQPRVNPVAGRVGSAFHPTGEAPLALKPYDTVEPEQAEPESVPAEPSEAPLGELLEASKDGTQEEETVSLGLEPPVF